MTLEEYNSSVHTWSDNLYRFMIKVVKDEDAAKDLVQDAYEKLWLNKDVVDSSKVKSWLFSTGYHKAIDFLRREKKKERLKDHQKEEGYTHSSPDLQKMLHFALNKLPEDQKSVVLLRDYEGYSYKEIAEITGLTESQVKVYIFRARVFLKKFIGSMEVLV